MLKGFLERPLPADKGRLWPILLTGAAQLVCLGMPPHAVVDLAVETTRRDRGAHRFAKLVNAVLRRVAERGADLLAGQDGVRLNIPDWLWQRWSAAYGAETARRIAEAESARGAARHHASSPTPTRQAWAERLGGRCCRPARSGSRAHGRIEDLPGFADGAWWVQDAAAALVARLAGDVAGKAVADLCAAPGGKTAQLAAAGAHGHGGRRVGRSGSSACARTSRACGSRPRWSRPTRRAGRRGAPSTWCCSMRRARPPAPSAAIPTSCA